MKDVTLEPLDDFLVVEPLEDTETPSGLIVPGERGEPGADRDRRSVGPDVSAIEPGDKVLYPATPATTSASPGRRTASAC